MIEIFTGYFLPLKSWSFFNVLTVFLKNSEKFKWACYEASCILWWLHFLSCMSTGSYRFTSLKNRELFGQANHLVMCSWDFFVFFAFFARKIAGHMGRPDGKVVMKDSLKPVAKKLEAGSTQTSHHGPRWIFWKNWKLLPNTTNDACFIINYTSFDLSSWGSCVNMFQNVLNQMRHLRNLSPTRNVQAIYFIHLYTQYLVMLEMSRASTPVDANIRERAHHVVTGGTRKKD